MPSERKKKMTLDQIIDYRIHIQGLLGADAGDWTGGEILPKDDGTTVINGCYDQASLHGVLAWLYSRGIPLISVNPMS